MLVAGPDADAIWNTQSDWVMIFIGKIQDEQ